MKQRLVPAEKLALCSSMQRRAPKNRLAFFAGSTTIALLGILVLQGYWLYNSYQQEHVRLRSEVENALSTAIIRTQFSEAYKVAGAGNLPLELQDAIGGILLSVIGTATENPGAFNTGFSNPDGTAKKGFIWSDEDTFYTPPPKSKADSTKTTSVFTATLGDFPDADLSKMQQVVQTVLQKNGIFAPVELALIDSNNAITETTNNRLDFQKAPLQTVLDNTISLKNGQRIQAAIPTVSGLLLRRMAFVLSLSGVFIILGSASFAYLLKLFFRQKRESEIRNDFLNNMTHELKTPISSVGVALELIGDKRYPLSEAAKEAYFSIAQSELARLILLVDKVLKMAAFERSEIVLAPHTFEVLPWLEGIVGGMKPLFESAGAEVELQVLPASLQLHGDKTHLANVVQNLLENALKYNDKTVPEMAISITEEEGFSLLTVTDNGRGIPPAYLSKVFDKFFRVPAGDRHDTKGYGLGLSYVKAIAELHRGSITVESTVGRQTCFSFRIPGPSHLPS